MKGNRGKDTRPEQQIRSALHAAGLRFRKHIRPVRQLRCHADIVFSREQVAVFVDGCFWHHCPEHGRVPGRNALYWEEKMKRNQVRDMRNTEILRKEGWLVLRYWEHEAPKTIAQEILNAVLDRRARVGLV